MPVVADLTPLKRPRRPAISIVVPCYNAEAFIEDCLRSVQAQTLSDWECLVVDDHSTDQSAKLVEELVTTDPRFKLLQLSSNAGPSTARNVGLDHAEGKWLTLLDADDLYVPSRLATLRDVAERTGAEIVFDDQIVTDYPSQKEITRAFHWIQAPVESFGAEDFFERSAQFSRSLNPGYMKPLVSLDFLNSRGLRYDPRFLSGQDFLFYGCIFAHKPICFVTKYAGYVYRRRVGSLSRSGGQHLRSHAELSEELLINHRDKFSESERNALQSRRAYYLRAAQLHDLGVDFREGRWLKAVASLFSRPAVWRAGLHAAVGRCVP